MRRNRTIQQHIEENLDELDCSDINSQRKRHLKSELDLLEKYQINHPMDDHDPTPLELYCDLNPDSLECKMFES